MSRVRVVAGPWPERINCTGAIVNPNGRKVYPWSGNPASQVVVLLDDDPMACAKRGCGHREKESFSCNFHPTWTFVTDAADVGTMLELI